MKRIKLSLLFTFGLIFNIILFLKLNYNFEIYLLIFIVLILLLSYLLALDIFYNRRNKIWLFTIPLIIFIIYIPWGLDMTDELYSLSLSKYFKNIDNNLIKINPSSYLIANILTQLLNKPYIFWERTIAAIIFASISFLAILLVIEVYKQKLNLLTSIFLTIATSFLTFYTYFLIPYDHLPILLLSLLSYTFYKALKTDNKLLYLLTGFLIIITIYSRITLWLFIPIFIIVVIAIYHRQILRLKTILYLLAGSVLGLMFLGLNKINLLLPIKSLLNFNLEIKESICLSQSDIYSISQLLNLYFTELKGIIKITFYISILYLPVMWLTNKSTTHKWLGTVILAAGLIFIYHKYNYATGNYKSWFYVIIAIWIITTLILLIELYKNKKLHKDFLYLLSVAALISLTAFVGSNVGLRKIVFSNAITILLAIPFLHNYFTQKYQNITLLSLILIFLIGYDYKISKNYRDYIKRPYTLKATFNIDILKGIHTTPEKVAIIEEFYQNLNTSKITLKDNYITANKTFLFSLLYDSPYEICWQYDPKAILKCITTNQNPQYVFFSNRSFRYITWDRKNILAIPRDLPVIKETKSILDSLYKPIVADKDSILILYQLKIKN